MTRTFRVLKSLGGCGGTIVSRALAANGALVLSEVNPRSANLFGGALNPLVQMNKHHSTLLPDTLRSIDIHTLGVPSIFGRFMADLVDALELPLVIRDYSYVDYIGVPFCWPIPTRACLREALDPFGGSKGVVLVRHPADCLRSLQGHAPIGPVLTPDIFVAGHLAFLEDNRDWARFRFEDFIDDPKGVVEAICAALELPIDPSWESWLADVPPLTGNRRGIVADAIEPSSVPRGQNALDHQLEAIPGYDRLLVLAGYAT